MMIPPDLMRRLGPVWLCVCLVLLAGCSASMVRTKGNDLMTAGQYEEALAVYSEGIKSYPDSAALRAAAARARGEAVQRLTLQSAAARQVGDADRAEAILKRAAKLDPDNQRVRALLLDIERDRRQNATLQAARELVAAGRTRMALDLVNASLADDPRNTGLLAVRRKLELDARAAEPVAGLQLTDPRPVSLEFRDVGIKMMLDALSRNTGVNIILDKDVRSDLRVTVFFRDTPLADALQLIASTNQLSTKALDGNTVLIYPSTPEKAKEYDDLVFRAFHLAHADGKQILATLKAMFKLHDPQLDERLNMIMLREAPETIRLVERVIALQDVDDAEVMFDVEVMEVSSSALTELGIQYPASMSFTVLPLSGATNLTLDALKNVGSDRIGVTTPSVTVNARREVGDVNVLANPKIRAKNREKAKVMIGDKVPVFTSTSNATGFVADSVQYLDVGLKLEVEPSVQLDDQVTIKVGLEVSSLGKEVRTSSGSLAYQIGTRNATTTLNLHDGETQLLAGLISKSDRMSANRVPGVGDLPVVGRLFGSQRDDGESSEIMLAITPHIVRNVRRPDITDAEFWSGSENRTRLKPLGRTQPEDDARGGKPGSKSAPAAKAPAANATLSWEHPAVLKVGDEFELPVLLKSGVTLRGIAAQLKFPPTQLQLLDVTEGSYWQRDGKSQTLTKLVPPGEGQATLSLVRNEGDVAAGEGSAFIFKFKAIGEGSGEVAINQVTPLRASAGVAPTLAAPAALRVSVGGG